MASVIPAAAKLEIATAWAAETLWVALFTAPPATNCESQTNLSTCTGQCTSTAGYDSTNGGKLHAFTFDTSGSDALLRTVGVTTTSWTGLTLVTPARYAVVYKHTGANAGPIRGVFDFGSNYSCTNGTLTITWNASGVIKVSSV